MRIFGYWTVFVALCISTVAAYYSIVGLVAIFAAAALPVIIMGTVLEVGKLTTAIWLHVNGSRAGIIIRSYLTIATLLLMFITSMGIFGFLSKAHIEQTSLATEGVAQLERIETEIIRNQSIISRAEEKIIKFENTGNTSDDSLQQKIDVEQARIDTAYDGINPVVADQQAVIDRAFEQAQQTLAPYTASLSDIDSKLSMIDEYVAVNEIKKLQGLIGAKQDGRYGANTAKAVQSFREGLITRRQQVLDTITSLRSAEDPVIIAARDEIKRLRSLAEAQIQQSNALINRLRTQVGSISIDTSAGDIAEQRSIISTANIDLDALFETKYTIEAESRKLDAEVGPVKYIAELVYGTTADVSMLEEAVRFVILILVIVFDPLAVALVISGIIIIEQNPKRRKEKKPEPPTALATDVSASMFTEEQVVQFVEEALRLSSVPADLSPLNTTTNDTAIVADTVIYNGVEYTSTDHDYARIKEQLELNDKLRFERDGIIKNLIDKS